jgi:hypothetical protein
MKTFLSSSIVGVLCGQFAYSAATVVERGIQFTEVDFVNSTMTLTNLNENEAVSLSGWRFCSHDENQTRRYSSRNGLNNLTLMPAQTLVIEFGSASGDLGTIGIGALGNFAGPFDRGPYSISLYDGGSFGQGANIVDHIQWSIDGVDNTTADERSDEAQSGGVWSNQSLWVATTAETELLVLDSPSATTILHGPASYLAQIPEPSALVLGLLGGTLFFKRRRAAS